MADYIKHVREDGGIVAIFPSSGAQIIIPVEGNATVYSVGGSSTSVTREEAAEYLGISPPEPPAAPAITALDPATAEVGAADVLMHVTGTGFTAGAVIIFNGGDEPTTFNSETDLSTTLKPSTASGAATVPVTVRNDDGQVSAPVDFSFTEPAPPANGDKASRLVPKP